MPRKRSSGRSRFPTDPEEPFLLLAVRRPPHSLAGGAIRRRPSGRFGGVIGFGPMGQMVCRIALDRREANVIVADRLPGRLEMARRHGVTVVDRNATQDLPARLAGDHRGPGPRSVIDAVGLEAHGHAAPTWGRGWLDAIAIVRRGARSRSRGMATRSITSDFATHHLPLSDPPHSFSIFQPKQEGVEVVLQPSRCAVR